MYADFFEIHGHAGAPDGGDDPSPIGIGPGPCSFHQGRGGNGAGDLSCFFDIAGLLNLEPHHMLYALSIGHDLPGQRPAHLQEGQFKLLANRLDLYIALAARENQHRVVGGGIAINGNIVEALVNSIFQCLL